MRREEITALHYITPIANVASILEHGLLSNRRVAQITHSSVAMPSIQERRAQVKVPNGRRLHEYVNLYFNARNPMMYYLHEQHRDLCVLKIDPGVMDMPNVVVATQNASTDFCRFASSPEGLDLIESEMVFADYWKHPDDLGLERLHKAIMCAEVLVPERIDPGFIVGGFASCVQSQRMLQQEAPILLAELNGRLFFR